MITRKDLIDVPLTPREGAVILLAAMEGRGVNLWLDADGCLRWDLTNSDVGPHEYAEGLRLLRDEFRSLLREREIREAVERSWPSRPTILQ
jgi:hypothetical protein